MGSWCRRQQSTKSPSPRRAWIEIERRHYSAFLLRRSPSPRRAWIEMTLVTVPPLQLMSPSPRRAWIEIVFKHWQLYRVRVALPTEGVD